MPTARSRLNAREGLAQGAPRSLGADLGDVGVAPGVPRGTRQAPVNVNHDKPQARRYDADQTVVVKSRFQVGWNFLPAGDDRSLRFCAEHEVRAGLSEPL